MVLEDLKLIGLDEVVADMDEDATEDEAEKDEDEDDEEGEIADDEEAL